VPSERAGATKSKPLSSSRRVTNAFSHAGCPMTGLICHPK
jgi:hypothetical protein